jgi:hypothetical protein
MLIDVFGCAIDHNSIPSSKFLSVLTLLPCGVIDSCRLWKEENALLPFQSLGEEESTNANRQKDDANNHQNDDSFPNEPFPTF